MAVALVAVYVFMAALATNGASKGLVYLASIAAQAWQLRASASDA